MNRKTVKHSFIASLPVAAGYIVLGIGFGLLLYDKGYSALWAFIMSVLIYAGSLQYVGVSLIAGGASLISVALTSAMVNMRHLFYGISMLGAYKGTGKRKPYLIFALTDETYSLVVSPSIPSDVSEKDYYLLVSVFNQCYWVIGSVIGGLLGNIFPFSTKGIDFSMTALFAVVLIEQWESADQHISAILGIITSVICLLIFGPDNFLIPTMVLITVCLFALKPVIEKCKKSCKNENHKEEEA